jgi:hypothetical protein
MRRAVPVLVATLIACSSGDGGTDPTPHYPIRTGRFVLQKVDGQPLPFTMPGSGWQLTSDTLQLAVDSNFYHRWHQDTGTPPPTNESLVMPFTMADSNVVRFPAGSTLTGLGTIAGDSMVVVSSTQAARGAHTWLYRRFGT